MFHQCNTASSLFQHVCESGSIVLAFDRKVISMRVYLRAFSETQVEVLYEVGKRLQSTVSPKLYAALVLVAFRLLVSHSTRFVRIKLLFFKKPHNWTYWN